MGTIILVNTGLRGSVDIDLPTGREHEMVVTRSKTTDEGVGQEVVKRIVKVHRPHSRTLAVGETIELDDSVLKDPVIASRLREGVLARRIGRRGPKKAKPTEEAARVKSEAPATPRAEGKGRKSGRAGKE